ILARRGRSGQRLDQGGRQERAVRPDQIGAGASEIVLDKKGSAFVVDHKIVAMAGIIAEEQNLRVGDWHGAGAVIWQFYRSDGRPVADSAPTDHVLFRSRDGPAVSPFAPQA